MKKAVALLVVLALAFALCACGSTTPSPSTDASAAPAEESNVLRVGMECNYAPYNWSQVEDGEGVYPIANVEKMFTNGYDVQVAAQIAKALGKDLEIYAYEWDSLIPAVESGKLDIIIAGMSPTAERREQIDFSENYYTSNLVVITKEAALDGVQTIADLDGKKIAAQSGTSHLEALSTQTKAEVNEMSDFSTMLIALDAGTIEGYIAEEPTAMAVCTEGSGYTYIPFVNNDTGFQVPIDDTSIAVGMKKGSELKAPIDEFIKTFGPDSQKSLMEEMVKISPMEKE